jgi:hypothetical protein
MSRQEAAPADGILDDSFGIRKVNARFDRLPFTDPAAASDKLALICRHSESVHRRWTAPGHN